ncbi:MAG: hypothetical protein KDK04_04105 [Candidatus Competibacteraceae bacterium]|nr:hypothetical protein [Candidatus Competibacteraceae bacterium]
MSKKGNLAAALTGFDRLAEEVEKPAQAGNSPAQGKKPASQGESVKTALPPSRQGKKALTGYFHPEVIRQLKMMAAAEDKTMQSLMAEAINELFKKYGKPHIA